MTALHHACSVTDRPCLAGCGIRLPAERLLLGSGYSATRRVSYAFEYIAHIGISGFSR
jgi:hypothetical protein